MTKEFVYRQQHQHHQGYENNVIHVFWYWGTGVDEGDTKLKCFTFDLFTLGINIH